MRRREAAELPGAFLLPFVLLTVPVLVFWSAATLRGYFFFGDVQRIYYPMKVALARALAAGQIPLWSRDLMGGYPLLAEGEGGFLYPVGLLFSLLIPPAAALNWQLLWHLGLAGLGTYGFCRAVGLDHFGSTLGGLVFMLSGFVIAHLDHLSITSTAAWLPVLFLLVELVAKRRRTGLWAALLAVAVGLQFLGGHAQVSFLSLLALGLYTIYRAGTQFVDGEGLGRPLLTMGASALAVALGAALAAPQLLATMELSTRSVRAGGLTGAFFTSFSLPPPYLATFVSPFLAGNPLAASSQAASVEWCGYLGILPLLLAPYAVLFRRDRYTSFFALLALLAIAFAFGQYNPLYQNLAGVPVFNSFRVPARFLLLYSFAVSVLAAAGASTLLHPGLPLPRPPARLAPILLGAATLVSWVLTVNAARDLTQLLTLWLFLPWALLVLGTLLLVLRGRQLMGEGAFAVLAAALLAVDLYAFVSVFGATFNATGPAEQLALRPQIVTSLLDKEEGDYRVYTRERITPAPVGVTESLFPNYALAAGVPSLNGYLPLGLSNYQEFAEQLDVSPKLADLSGVKYLLVPQSVASDEAIARDNLANPYAPSPVGRTIGIPATGAVALEVESFLSAGVDVPDGTIVGEVVVSDGTREETLPVRAGSDTAEWAYDRPDVRARVKHQQPAAKRAWPANSGYPPVNHDGYSYTTTLRLSREMAISSLAVRTLPGTGYLHVDRVSLVTSDGQKVPLGQLAGWGDYQIAYRSEMVVAFRNLNSQPGAFLTHSANVVETADAAWQRLLAPDFKPAEQVVLGPADPAGRLAQVLALNPLGTAGYGQPPGGEPAPSETVQVVSRLPQSTALRVGLTSPGYLVLTDTYYPGWQAYVDGERVPVLRADWLYRAVELPPGVHQVEFRYEPGWLGLGWLLSALAALATAALALGFTARGVAGRLGWRPG